MSEHEQSPMHELADRLFNENKTWTSFRPIRDALRPATMAAGYQVQDLLNARYIEDGRGPIAGYKVGLTSEKIRKLCGVHEPIAGTISVKRRKWLTRAGKSLPPIGKSTFSNEAILAARPSARLPVCMHACLPRSRCSDFLKASATSTATM